MNLSKIVERQIQSVFKFAGGIVKTAIYKYLSDINTANYRKELEFTETLPFKCLITKYSRNDIETALGDIEFTDKKVLVPLKNLAVTIRTKNFLIIDGYEYQVKNVETDPTGTLCIVQCRLWG